MKAVCRDKKLFLVLGLVALLLVACGTGDFGQPESNTVEVAGVRISVSLIPNDGFDLGSGHHIDVEQDICDPNAVPPELEKFYNTIGELSFSIASNTEATTYPNFYITRYVVEYLPKSSPDPVGGTFMPPDLPGFSQETTIVLDGTSSEITGSINLISINTKTYFSNTTLYSRGLYTIRVTLYGQSEFGDRFTLPVEYDVLLSNFDNC